MREYKFRGKRKDNGEWVYGNLLSGLIKNEYAICTNPRIDKKLNTTIFDTFPVIAESIGQCSNLEDKNRKEFYENDYLKMNNKIFKVVKYFGAFGLESIKGEFWEYICNLACAQYGEIVGNIHENPELLEDEGWIKR